MAITYKSGRRIQGTSADVAVIASRGTVTTDGSDTIITFTESGTFTPTSSFNVEYLVIAGGGSGGSTIGGHSSAGGGAGGYRTTAGHAVTAQSYDITVGSGGVATASTIGVNGGDSVFSTITSTGGGGGGTRSDTTSLQDGANGGSGGGGGTDNSGSAHVTTGGISSPVTSPVQGYAGGTGKHGAGSYAGGGGGGGSSSIGTNSASDYGGNGGAGTSSSITGSSVTRAGGGGGGGNTGYGSGGSGGGGDGMVINSNGNAGTVNTGSGGGSSGSVTGNLGGTGGSGIVIIKFVTSGNTYETSLGGKPTNVQVGSRFEETDTRTMYHRDDIDFKEEGGAEATNYRFPSMYQQLSGEVP